MRIAIVGSRDYPDELQVRRYVQGLPQGTTVVSGGADGVDTWAVDEARRCGLTFVVICPEERGHPRQAPRERNKAIVGMCDELVAFWGPIESPGTSHVVALAAGAGKLREVIRPRVLA